MTHWTKQINQLPTPCYLTEEEALIKNLTALKKIKEQTDCHIILALKGFSTFHTFPLCASIIDGVTASSVYEARLGREEFPGTIHIHSIGMDEADAKYFNEIGTHISFNSKTQQDLFLSINNTIKPSMGLRINPMISNAPSEKYNPCGQYSRLGIPIHTITPNDFETIDGLHFHALCEQNTPTLFKILDHIESLFGNSLNQLKWMNWGGGHKLTDDNYNTSDLIKKINEWKSKYNIQIILEPGDAIIKNAGVYVCKVMDIITNKKNIAVCDISATAHMPDILEYPYKPTIANAKNENELEHNYIIAGNTCLAGDIMGTYSFKQPLNIGDSLIFNDMGQYTIVKTSNFNGVKQPSIGIINIDQTVNILSCSSYFNFKERLS